MVKETALAPTPSKDRREQEKLATREKILDAAREMFNEDGVEATTMRAIAERIGYTATAIYYHFKDKDALLLELCHCDFSQLARVISQAGTMPDPIDRIRAVGMAYVEFGLTNPSQYRFMFLTASRSVTPEEVHLHKGNPEEDAYAFLLATVKEAMAQGRFRAEYTDPVAIANILWSSVHGVTALYMTKKHDAWVEFGDPRQLASMMIDVVTRGLTA